MILTLASHGLNHSRARFLATLVAAALALMLVAIQLGMMAGFERMISGSLDHSDADLWIVPAGTESFDEAATLDMSARYEALRVDGVASVSPVVVGFADWRGKAAHATTVVVVGSDPAGGGPRPWNISPDLLPHQTDDTAIIADMSYAGQLGIEGVGQLVSIEGKTLRVAAMTTGIRSFTTSPYIFTTLTAARKIMGLSERQGSYLLVKLAPGSSASAVQAVLKTSLPRLEVLTASEFRWRNLSRWLLETGAGEVLLAGAVMGFLVGAVIIAQTMHTSIRENKKQLATLRAMGASDKFLAATITLHAAITTGVATLIALLASIALVHVASVALPISFTVGLGMFVVALACGMSLLSAAIAYRLIAKTDPAMVLTE